jgi:hypothetical protein
MLQELQKTHKQFRNLEALALGLIREEYEKKNGKQLAIKRIFADPLVLLSFAGVGRGVAERSRTNRIHLKV